MVSQDSLLVTLVQLVDRLPMPLSTANVDAGIRRCTQIACS